MKQKTSLMDWRWLCVLPAVGISFYTCVMLSFQIDPHILEKLLHLGLISGEVQGDGAPRYMLVWDGPFAAIVFVLVGAFVAPSYRRATALVLFGLGACLTPGIAEYGNFVAYTHVPLDVEKIRVACVHWATALTYLAGLLAVAVVFLVTRKSSTPWSA